MGGRSPFGPARVVLGAIVLGGACMPSVAAAQDGLIVQAVIPQGFSRDRNVSVLSKSRPSYDALGISVGGLVFSPSVRTNVGGTSNTYLTNQNEIASAYVSLEPSLAVSSIWSRHSLSVTGSTSLRNYLGQSPRNERAWDVGANGEVELGRAIKIIGEASASQSIENQFSGEVATTVAALSRFRRDFVSLRAQYAMGRVRTFIVADHASFRFKPVDLTSGGVRDQSSRDRTVNRLTGQFEYARTPSVSFFAQLGYTDTTFDRQPAGTSLDSDSVRLLGGANIDIAGRMRGTIGIGYVVRDYRTVGFDTVTGLVAEGRVELFPSELFTITTGARRTVEDSTFGVSAPRPFWDNRLTLRADYELLRNMIVSASGEYSLQTFIVNEQRNSTYRLGSNARYLMSRRLTLEGSISYTSRSSSGSFQNNSPSEGRVQAGLFFHI